MFRKKISSFKCFEQDLSLWNLVFETDLMQEIFLLKKNQLESEKLYLPKKVAKDFLKICVFGIFWIQKWFSWKIAS